MEPIRLYRRRYVPDEIIELKNDKILLANEDIIVTSWNVLKPRKDIDHGISIYYIKKGFKISKILNARNQFVYWYCDIIETSYNADTNAYTFHDLLIDILIYPDNRVEVVDLDEFADFTEQNGISSSLLASALRRTNDLLQYIYSGRFDMLTQPILSYEQQEHLSK